MDPSELTSPRQLRDRQVRARPKEKEARSFAFVPVDAAGRPKPTHRTLVRRHVMFGKNLRIGKQPLPKFAPSVTPILPFAAELDESSRHALLSFLDTTADTWYPNDIGIDFEVAGNFCFRWLCEDAAYLHSLLFAVHGVRDIYLRGRFTPRTYLHLTKAITALNENIANSTGLLLQSTVAAIVSLVLLSASFNDVSAARLHMKGLQDIVHLHGGLKAFRNNPSLHIRLSRVDFAYFLYAGHEPVFFTDPETLVYFSEKPITKQTESGRTPLRIPKPIAKLANQKVAMLFSDMQQLSELLNSLAGSKQKLHHIEFQHKICSIQYRLLQLHSEVDEGLEECLVLAMLAFLTTPFQLPYNGIRYPYLSTRFRQCFSTIDVSAPELDDLVLWLLTIAAISLYGVHDPWLQHQWRTNVPEEMKWPDAKLRLRKFIWIDTIHGKVGQLAFASLNNGVVEKDEPSRGFWASGWAMCPYRA